MGLSHSSRIVTDGLVFCVDAGDKMSYPGAGTTWTDLSKNRNNGTLINGPTFDSANGGSISLDGSNDYISVGSFNEDSSQDLSVMVWVYPIVLDGGSSSGKDYSWIINKREISIMSHSEFDHRHYVVISSGDASLVNFDEVMETSINTLRYSVDGTQTFVKYEGDQPASVASCPSKSVEQLAGND